MAKRGRPPKDDAIRKSEPISIRLTSDLRARLEDERKDKVPERTLSQEIEQRIRESFDLGQTIKQLLGGADHYWLLRVVAELIVSIEYQTGRHFLKDRFTFDQVKTAINTVLDHWKPSGPSSLPERLNVHFDEPTIKALGKRSALLSLTGLELGHTRGDVPVLPDFVDPIAASRQLPTVRKSAFAELNKDWQRTQAEAKTATTTKSRRKPK
jgi:hypothetical protein